MSPVGLAGSQPQAQTRVTSPAGPSAWPEKTPLFSGATLNPPQSLPSTSMLFQGLMELGLPCCGTPKALAALAPGKQV